MSEMTNEARLQWWHEARFGMFIHWGLYAVPAGTWKGEKIPSLGEWIMRNAKIPIEEYEQLAPQFNPVKFDAEEWVSVAKNAGMKYLVITSKHHDGFCIFDSPSNPFNIVAATPFGRDPLAELAEACRKHGIRLGFYYSQSQDWHAPGGAGHWEQAGAEKNWNKYAGKAEEFAAYLEAVVKPNLKELLTQYGPVGLIWFDTPVCITREQSLDLRDYVHSLQPECLVSGRVGNDVGDYGSMGDNQIPAGRVKGAWETPATLNDTWGFKSYDDNWKSVDTLLYLLVDLASKGVNYLLNVGPTGEGLIPQPSIELLGEIGDWMAVNGEAIHGSQAGPFPYELDWGRLTSKGNALYLMITDWPGCTLTLRGIRNRACAATLLGSPDTEISISQTHDSGADWHEIVLGLPEEAPEGRIPVVKLELDGVVDADESPLQQANGQLLLAAYMGAIEGDLSIERTGFTAGWNTTEPKISWDCKVCAPGRFRVEVVSAGTGHGAAWKGGHEFAFSIAGQSLCKVLEKDRDSTSPRSQHHPEAVSVLGEVELKEAGTWMATASLTAIADAPKLRLAEICLVPVNG